MDDIEKIVKYAEPDDTGRFSQGIVTKFSYKRVGNDTFFSIEQGKNVVLLTKNEISKMFIEKGKQLIERWKINNGLLKKAHGD